jgi:purine/pyrimidine-nucleoside phosphorylase
MKGIVQHAGYTPTGVDRIHNAAPPQRLRWRHTTGRHLKSGGCARPRAFFHHFQPTMPTDQLTSVTVTTKANVYFDGKCVSHSLMLADGSKKSVGVILPGNLVFNTGTAEIMECVAGACEYKLAGTGDWVKSSAGEKFSVPAHSKFEIRVADGHEAYHYICHFA